MTEWIWINGDLMPLAEARISVEDRGFQFADGVYEVVRVYNGRPFTLAEHLSRLARSAAGIELAMPLAPATLADVVHKVVARSEIREGMVYLQLTRGAGPRNHLFPAAAVAPTALCYARALPPVPAPGKGEGVRLLPVPDERWKRCWVKSIALLANVLAKNAAAAACADEAIFVEDGVVTECSSTNLFAVVGGKLVTHPVGPKVLPGITRAVLIELAAGLGIGVDERPLREEEAIGADELFITSTTRELSWVARWGNRTVGVGRCGPVALKLHHAYREKVRRDTEGAQSLENRPLIAPSRAC